MKRNAREQRRGGSVGNRSQTLSTNSMKQVNRNETDGTKKYEVTDVVCHKRDFCSAFIKII